MRGTWTCQRQQKGVRCGTKNPNRLRKCSSCGKHKPARKRPAHMAALDLTYEQYIELNGGEHCGICGAGKPANRKLDRDHDHKTGKPRGLLCRDDNRKLRTRIATPKWLRAAADYLERTA